MDKTQEYDDVANLTVSAKTHLVCILKLTHAAKNIFADFNQAITQGNWSQIN